MARAAMLPSLVASCSKSKAVISLQLCIAQPPRRSKHGCKRVTNN